VTQPLAVLSWDQGEERGPDLPLGRHLDALPVLVVRAASSARRAWIVVVDYMLAAMWIVLFVVLHVGLLRVLFGAVPTVDPSRPIERPTGPGVAAFGLFILLGSCLYLVVLALNRDSYWAERFLDLRVFMIGFLAGSYIFLASRVPERLLGPAFGGSSLLRRFEASIGSDPKYSLLVVIPAGHPRVGDHDPPQRQEGVDPPYAEGRCVDVFRTGRCVGQAEPGHATIHGQGGAGQEA
jgi:hypothetical protein